MPRYRSPVLQVLECAHTQSWWQLNFSSVKNVCSVRNYFNNLWNGILRNSGFNSHLVPDQAGSRGSLSQMFSCFPNLNIPEQLGVFPATQNSLCWILQLKDWGSPTGTPMSYGWVPAWTTLPTRSSPSVFSAAPPRCHPLSACQLRLLLSISGLMQLWLLDIFTESNICGALGSISRHRQHTLCSLDSATQTLRGQGTQRRWYYFSWFNVAN